MQHSSEAWGVRLMRGAVYGVVVTMPLSVLYPLTEPLGPGPVELYVTPGLEAADIPAGILLLLAAVDRWRMSRRSGQPAHKKSLFARLVLLLSVLGFASIAVAEAPGLAAFTALRWLQAAAVLWAINRSRVAPQRLAYVLGLSLCVHAVVALLQVWHAGPIGVPGELTLSPDQSSAAVVQLGDRLWLRGYGMTFHPNLLGGYFAVGLILMLPLSARPLALLIECILTAGLVATLSRSAGLGLLLAVPPLGWWLRRADRDARTSLRRAATVFACIAVVSIAVFWKPMSVRLDPLLVQLGLARGEPVLAEQDSLDGRQRLNALAIDLMWRHPLLGIGAGNFPIAMAAVRKDMAPQYVHNVPLLLGAEVGVVGLFVWLAIAACAVVLARRTPNKWVAAGAAAWWALFVVSLLDCYPWSLNSGRLLTVMVLALIESNSPPSPLSWEERGTRK